MQKLIEKYYGLLLGVVLFFAMVTRLNNLAHPPTYIFDEVYHALTAKLMARNDVRAFEWWNPPVEPTTAVDWLHPPLAKYTQALSMRIFGENSFGWRFSSAVFGVLTIFMVAVLSKAWFKSSSISLLAAFLASLDGLLLVQSRIAMNDIHVTFAILLTMWCYHQFRTHRQDGLHNLWLLATGVSCGLAVGSKWSGLFVVLAVWVFESSEFLWHVIRKVRASDAAGRFKSLLQNLFMVNKARLRAVLALFILPLTLYVLSYSLMFAQGKSLICTGNAPVQGQCYCRMDSSWWVTFLSTVFPPGKETFMSWEARGGCTRLISHFWELHHQIWGYQTTLEATHPYQSRPLEWFLDLRPVWMYVNYQDDKISNIYAIGNPLLFWIGDLVIIYFVFVAIARSLPHVEAIAKNWNKPAKLPTLTWTPFTIALLTYFMVWLPWQKSPRIMFFYHYTPAVPFLCILFAYFLVTSLNHPQLKENRDFMKNAYLTVVALIVVVFLIWYPNWTGIPVVTEWANRWYFAVPSWK